MSGNFKVLFTSDATEADDRCEIDDAVRDEVRDVLACRDGPRRAHCPVRTVRPRGREESYGPLSWRPSSGREVPRPRSRGRPAADVARTPLPWRRLRDGVKVTRAGWSPVVLSGGGNRW